MPRTPPGAGAMSVVAFPACGAGGGLLPDSGDGKHKKVSSCACPQTLDEKQSMKMECPVDGMRIICKK